MGFANDVTWHFCVCWHGHQVRHIVSCVNFHAKTECINGSFILNTISHDQYSILMISDWLFRTIVTMQRCNCWIGWWYAPTSNCRTSIMDIPFTSMIFLGRFLLFCRNNLRKTSKTMGFQFEMYLALKNHHFCDLWKNHCFTSWES